MNNSQTQKKQTEPLISIIMPAYNVESYIGKSIESIQNQTCKEIEIVIVNDGSTDRTSAIIDEYAGKDSRIVAIHQKNGGVSSARNTGIETAKGVYIGFVDSDDIVESGMYELLLKNALEHDADISHCGYNAVYSDRTVNRFNSEKIFTQNGSQAIIAMLNDIMAGGNLWTKLYSAKMFEDFRFNENVKFQEDLLANYHLFSKTDKVVFADKAMYNYCLRAGSLVTSKQSASRFRDAFFVKTEILERTERDSEIYPAVFNSYLQLIIGIPSVPKKNIADEEAVLFQRQVRKELGRNILPIIKSKGLSLKFKAGALMILYFSPFYFCMHSIYAVLRKKRSFY